MRAVANCIPRTLGTLLPLAPGATAGPWRQERGQDQDPGSGVSRENGRIEATESDIATWRPGRVAELLVHEGDMVKAGQVLARMHRHTLPVQRPERAARDLKAEVPGVPGVRGGQ